MARPVREIPGPLPARLRHLDLRALGELRRHHGRLSGMAGSAAAEDCGTDCQRQRQGVVRREIADQMEKLVPQPQEAVALGFTTRNEAPIRSSTKSTSDPARNGTEAESTSTTAPSREITRSSSALAWSTSNLYWNPEQPPPSTLMRSIAPSPWPLRISPIPRVARSLPVMAVVIVRISKHNTKRHTQFIWYPALSIVKCADKRNQMDKD